MSNELECFQSLMHFPWSRSGRGKVYSGIETSVFKIFTIWWRNMSAYVTERSKMPYRFCWWNFLDPKFTNLKENTSFFEEQLVEWITYFVWNKSCLWINAVLDAWIEIEINRNPTGRRRYLFSIKISGPRRGVWYKYTFIWLRFNWKVPQHIILQNNWQDPIQLCNFANVLTRVRKSKHVTKRIFAYSISATLCGIRSEAFLHEELPA